MILDILIENTEYDKNNNLSILNEAYYGKNELLLDCEKQFGELKKLIKQYGIAYNLDMDKGKEYTVIITKIENNFKKLFGFDDVVVNFVSLGGTCNAFTFSNDYDIEFLLKSINKTEKLVKTQYGSMALPKGNNKILVINITHAIIQEATPSQLVGIVLHEIGHNFYNIKSTSGLNTTMTMALLVESLLPVSLINTCLINLKIPHILNKLKNKISKDNNMYRLLNLNDIYESNVSIILTTINNLMSNPMLKLGSLVIGLMSILIHPVHSISGYRNEKFADRFASSYGYSEDVVSIQSKFISNSYAGKNEFNYINNFFDDLYKYTIMIPMLVLDPHPSTYTRMKDQLRYLEKQLEIEKNPKLKKYIKQDLNNCKELLSYYEKAIPAMAAENGKLFTSIIYDSFARQGYKPDDIRELFTITKSSVNDLEFNDLE